MEETVEISDARTVEELKNRLGALAGGWKTQWVTSPSPDYVLVFRKGDAQREVVFLGPAWIETHNLYRVLPPAEIAEIVEILRRGAK